VAGCYHLLSSTPLWAISGGEKQTLKLVTICPASEIFMIALAGISLVVSAFVGLFLLIYFCSFVYSFFNPL